MAPTAIIIGEGAVHLLALVCVALSFYGNYVLFQIKTAMFIQKRKISILFGTNLSLITLIALGPILTAFRIHANEQRLFTMFGDILATLCYYTFLFFCVTRQWMIYFTHKWTYFTLQAKWQDIITNSRDTSNWFISNKHRYGSLSFMYKVFGTYHLFAAVIGILSTVAYNYNVLHSTITMTMFTMPIACSSVVYSFIVCKTPRATEVEDIFYIFWESKMHARLLCLMLLLFVLYSMYLSNFQDFSIVDIIYYCAFTSVTYAMHHVSTYSIHAKNVHSKSDHSTVQNHGDGCLVRGHRQVIPPEIVYKEEQASHWNKCYRRRMRSIYLCFIYQKNLPWNVYYHLLKLNSIKDM
eukprot:637715_1